MHSLYIYSMNMGQGLGQGYRDKKDLVLSLQEFMFFHSRVILPLSWELLTRETHVVLISVPLVPSTAPGTH